MHAPFRGNPGRMSRRTAAETLVDRARHRAAALVFGRVGVAMSFRIYRSCLVPALAAALAAAACTTEVNRQPSLPRIRAVTDEDVAVELHVLAEARDPDGDSLTLVSASAIGHQVAIKPGGIIVVTPQPDYSGTIEVAFEVTDHHSRSATGSAVVTVRPVNDAPVAGGGSRKVHGTDAIVLDGKDVDGDALSYAITSGPLHGTLTGSPPVMQYAPDPGFVGDDAISYRVSDGALSSASATLELHVGPGEAPVALADTVTVDEDHALELILHATDADDDALKFAIVTPPASGALTGTPPHLIYTPRPEFSGDDAVVFSVSDGYLASGNATVTIHVTPVNDAPVAVAQAIDAVEDTSRTIALAGSDVDGDPLSFQIKTPPAHGTLATSGATVTYQPALNYHGPDQFTFAAFDGKLASEPATVAIAVAAVDDPPVATSFQVTLAEDAAGAAVGLLGGDVDGDPLGYALGAPPANGTLLGTPPALTYVPNPNFNGTDSFTYTVTAAGASSAVATVTLKVTPVNDPPVAGDTNHVKDVLVCDRIAGTTTRVSVTTNGGEANGASSGPALSNDGRYISFLSLDHDAAGGLVVEHAHRAAVRRRPVPDRVQHHRRDPPGPDHGGHRPAVARGSSWTLVTPNPLLP